jgi:dTMP kinase
VTETLLHFAARRDHLTKTVRPALERGAWVVCDRFADSTMAYQGYGHGLEPDRLIRLYALTAGDFFPDLTLIIDLPVEEGLKRAQARGGADRYERMGIEFHERIRTGFREIAEDDPDRCRLIDGTGDEAGVAAAIAAAVGARFGREFA